MSFEVLRLGRMGYLPAWEEQRRLHAALLEGGPETLVFVEHDPVLTLGASFHPENLLHPPEFYADRGIEVLKTDRGGDVTYHGPGQLVIYPIFDVSRHGKDLHRWMRDLEETMLQVLASFGLEGERRAPHTGAWCRGRKAASIGVKVRRWASLHGIALNCSCALEPFDWIVPCGIPGSPMTSLTELGGRLITPESAIEPAVEAFRAVFADPERS
jgi:lipoate-protein ligase B